MYVLQIALLAIGLLTLVIGYRKNSRNTLLVSALVLLVAGALPEFVSGFVDGSTSALGMAWAPNALEA